MGWTFYNLSLTSLDANNFDKLTKLKFLILKYNKLTTLED